VGQSQGACQRAQPHGRRQGEGGHRAAAAGKKFFPAFKDIKGNPYNEIVFANVEALDQAGDFDALLKIMPEVKAIKWEEDKKFQLRILELNMNRRTRRIRTDYGGGGSRSFASPTIPPSMRASGS